METLFHLTWRKSLTPFSSSVATTWNILFLHLYPPPTHPAYMALYIAFSDETSLAPSLENNSLPYLSLSYNLSIYLYNIYKNLGLYVHSPPLQSKLFECRPCLLILYCPLGCHSSWHILGIFLKSIDWMIRWVSHPEFQFQACSWLAVWPWATHYFETSVFPLSNGAGRRWLEAFLRFFQLCSCLSQEIETPPLRGKSTSHSR